MEVVDAKIEMSCGYLTSFGRHLFGFSDEALRVLFGESGPGCRAATMEVYLLDEYDVSKVLQADQVTPEMRRKAIELEAYKCYESEQWRVMKGESEQERRDRHWFAAERNVDVLLGMLLSCKRR